MSEWWTSGCVLPPRIVSLSVRTPSHLCPSCLTLAVLARVGLFGSDKPAAWPGGENAGGTGCGDFDGDVGEPGDG